MWIHTRIPPGNCFFFGEKVVQFLLDVCMGVGSMKYKMLRDLLLPRYTLKLNATYLFWGVAFASSHSALNLLCITDCIFFIS